MADPKVIGEGTYGCVFRPAVQCKNKSIGPNHISKLMKRKNALDELNEFQLLNKLDPQSVYHLGEQFVCEPNLDSEKVKQTIMNRCENIDIEDLEENPNQYSLLIGKYGGPDLKNFCKQYARSYFSRGNKAKKKRLFLEQMLHLMKGLRFFKQNNLVHYDLKPQNILFHLKDGKMKFIDFGLMGRKTDIMYKSENNKNFLGTFHWSYPLETGFMNKYNFQIIPKTAQIQKESINEIWQQILAKQTMDSAQFQMRNPESYAHMLKVYMNAHTKKQQLELIEGLYDFFEYAKENTYEKVLNEIVDSIDIFGLGISFKYMTMCLKENGVLSEKEFLGLNKIISGMVDYRFSKRTKNVDDCIKQMEQLLRGKMRGGNQSRKWKATKRTKTFRKKKY